jgi:hypothetical protein
MVAIRSALAPAWLLALAVSLCALASPALAQTSLLGGLLGRPSEGGPRSEAPPVARYVSETGETFVFDRSSTRAPMLRFEGSNEVWVLSAQYAPRGDIVYKNDQGRTMLRATRVGGLTLFTAERPGGSAAAVEGGSSPLRLAPMGPQQLFHILAVASARASHAAQRLVPIEADATPESAALVGDAAMVASEAMLRLARRADGRALLAKISRIMIGEGAKPAVGMDKAGAIRIVVSPPLGLPGRPSSDRICWTVGAR